MIKQHINPFASAPNSTLCGSPPSGRYAQLWLAHFGPVKEHYTVPAFANQSSHSMRDVVRNGALIYNQTLMLTFAHMHYRSQIDKFGMTVCGITLAGVATVSAMEYVGANESRKSEEACNELAKAINGPTLSDVEKKRLHQRASKSLSRKK